AGGALGGLFNVFVAPTVFRTLLEYPIGLCAAALLRPAPAGGPGGPPATRRGRRRDVLVPVALGAALLLGVRAAHAIEAAVPGKVGMAALVVLLATSGAVVYSFRSRPLRFGLALA